MSKFIIRNFLVLFVFCSLMGGAIAACSLPLLLLAVAYLSIHWELYKVKIKVENSCPWY